MKDWQTIETAPTDGTEINVLFSGSPSRMFKCHWQDGSDRWPHEAGWVFTTGLGSRGIVTNSVATHWRPLRKSR